MAAVEGILFPHDEVRAGLLLAMRMGTPNEFDVEFHFDPSPPTGGPSVDAEGVPFKVGTAIPTVVVPDPVVVPCAVEFFTGKNEIVDWTEVRADRIVLTLLGEEWDLVEGFTFVQIGSDQWFYGYQQPVVGLFTLDVRQVHCMTRDRAGR